MARMAPYWSLAVLLAYGCVQMRAELTSWMPDSVGAALGGMTVPLVGLPLSPALILAAAPFVLGLLFLSGPMEKPTNADLLIETESELRKVTWPTLDETVDGSIVVMVVVIFLMGFMAGADYVLGEVFGRILTGRA